MKRARKGGRADRSASSARWQTDDERNVRLYTQFLRRHGISARALDWGSAESQALRFRVLAEVGELDGASVLDVGCGLGDLWAWLRRNGIRARYTGVDLAPAMIEAARRRFPRVYFRTANLLAPGEMRQRYDYVLCSGLFTYRRVAPTAYLEAMVERMYGLCRRAVAFNSLSAWAEKQEAGEFHADPLRILRFCRSLAPWVTLRHDYHARDFTLYLYRTRKA